MVSTLCVSILAVINRGYYELAFGDTNSLLIILEILLSTIGYVLLFLSYEWLVLFIIHW